MSRHIREYRNELRTKSIALKEQSNIVSYNKSVQMRKEQDEYYKKWQFVDKLIKAMDKQGKK